MSLRCPICDGALRGEMPCGSCGHRVMPSCDDEPALQGWRAFDEALRRVDALRSLGVEGRLLAIGEEDAFVRIASAGPFEVTRVSWGDGLGAFAPSSFSVVTMWRGLERVEEPVKVLEEARGLLVGGGLVGISVGLGFTESSLRLAVLRAGLVAREFAGRGGGGRLEIWGLVATGDRMS